MVRREFRLLAAALTMFAIGCDPDETGFTDLPALDAAVNDGQQTQDVRPDRPAPTDSGMDAAPLDAGCVAAVCDEMCINERGGLGGTCRQGNCVCIGVEEPDGGPDGAADARRDVTPEITVRSCMTNADCPSSMYCSGSACSGAGFCDFRATASTCGTTGPVSCGCDGMLYANTCARTAAGVRSNPRGCADATVSTDAASGADTGSAD